MEYQLNIPKIEVTLEAKDKKQALKEARKIIDVLLKNQGYWKEIQCLSTHGAAGYAPGSLALPDGSVRCGACGQIIKNARKEAIREDMKRE